MRTFVSNLTAAMLVVHALVGCCRHHDHLFVGCDSTERSDSLVADCCHADRAPAGHSEERPFAPCDCKLECKALCISLPPEKSLLDAGESVPCIDVVAVASARGSIFSSTAHAYRGATRDIHASPPLRLHLLHQIILI
jgi:hypothetical protein